MLQLNNYSHHSEHAVQTSSPNISKNSQVHTIEDIVKDDIEIETIESTEKNQPIKLVRCLS